MSAPVPSISWSSTYRETRYKSGYNRSRTSRVHFKWEFGKGDTACGKHIPQGSVINLERNRKIDCPSCLSIIYGISAKKPKESVLFVKSVKNNEDLVELILEEIDKFKATGNKSGTHKRVAEAIGISQREIGDILRGKLLVNKKVAEYFGYTIVVGFLKE